jgi:hypothetical protein
VPIFERLNLVDYRVAIYITVYSRVAQREVNSNVETRSY